MPQGLQVWDENENLIVDTSTSLTLLAGSFTVPKNVSTGVSGTVTHPCFAEPNWFVHVVGNTSGATNIIVWGDIELLGWGIPRVRFKFSVSGTTLTWEVVEARPAYTTVNDIIIQYGTF